MVSHENLLVNTKYDKGAHQVGGEVAHQSGVVVEQLWVGRVDNEGYQEKDR
jgi:hypothetical protein